MTSDLTAVLEVPDVGARAAPPLAPLLGGPLRVQQRLHAVAVQTPALRQVDDGEAVRGSGPHLPHSEVEPLHVLAGVQVRAQRQLVVMETPGRESQRTMRRRTPWRRVRQYGDSHSDRFEKVPTLEAGLELQGKA